MRSLDGISAGFSGGWNVGEMLPPLAKPFIPNSLWCPFKAVRLCARTHVTAKLQRPLIGRSAWASRLRAVAGKPVA